MQGIRTGPKARWLVVLGVVVVLVMGGLGVAAFQPWTANHFGYALPGQDGLPYRIHAFGRSYATYQVCAGASWCAAERAQMGINRCRSQADLASHSMWPLASAGVGSIFTLFGAAHPILTSPGPHGLTLPLIVADGSDCYVVYSLEGGP